jgi:hypothetical protein
MSMKKTFLIMVFLLSLLGVHTHHATAESMEIPEWVTQLREFAVRAFHTEVNIFITNQRDHIDGKEYKIIRLQGNGSLKEVPQPFYEMRTLFLSNGWIEDMQYMADGHGSSSTGYRKGACFCVTSVQIDSSCDDEESGHIPGEFWFSLDCRESGVVMDKQTQS